MKCRARLLLAISLALLLVAGSVMLAAPGWHPSDSRYPVQGIDVSHHQGTINWSSLPDQDVDFAYIKATEGGDYRDPKLAENWRNSAAAGVRRGAYHFFTLCRSGAEQAANFIAAVPKDVTALPPALDLEYLGNCGKRPSPAEVRSEIQSYLTAVERFYGRPAVLYLTAEFDQAYAVRGHFDRPIWWRSIVLRPRLDGQPWTLWQASNFRRLDGIKGRVDWNVVDLTSLHAPFLSEPQPLPVRMRSPQRHGPQPSLG